MNEVKIFTYHQDMKVRTVMKDGDPWFVLKDVCAALALNEPHRVAARLNEDEKGSTQITTPGGPQKMTIISESGLYSVILRSDKKEAEPFRRWVTHEVLPEIRKTGAYISSDEIFDGIFSEESIAAMKKQQEREELQQILADEACKLSELISDEKARSVTLADCRDLCNRMRRDRDKVRALISEHQGYIDAINRLLNPQLYDHNA